MKEIWEKKVRELKRQLKQDFRVTGNINAKDVEKLVVLEKTIDRVE